MNGVHDLGGMQGFGPIIPEKNEPVFHARWEGRLVAIRKALVTAGKLPGVSGSLRNGIETLPPAEYLSKSYYEHWYSAVVALLVQNGVATREEIASGKPAKNSTKAVPVLKPEDAGKVPFRIPQVMLKVDVPQRFSVGQTLR